MSEAKKTSIRDMAYLYQAALKANFLPEVFMQALGTEINHDMIREHLDAKIESVMSQLIVIKELIDDSREER